LPEKKVKFPLPNGQTAEGFEIPIIETVERWTEIRLEDGSVLKIKPVVMAVTRIEGQFDPEGNPMYAVRAGHSIATGEVGPGLRRKVQ
jgi:hypothetical protein